MASGRISGLSFLINYLSCFVFKINIDDRKTTFFCIVVVFTDNIEDKKSAFFFSHRLKPSISFYLQERSFIFKPLKEKTEPVGSV
jgi:hypothetical protein